MVTKTKKTKARLVNNDEVTVSWKTLLALACTIHSHCFGWSHGTVQTTDTRRCVAYLCFVSITPPWCWLLLITHRTIAGITVWVVPHDALLLCLLAVRAFCQAHVTSLSLHSVIKRIFCRRVIDSCWWDYMQWCHETEYIFSSTAFYGGGGPLCPSLGRR